MTNKIISAYYCVGCAEAKEIYMNLYDKWPNQNKKHGCIWFNLGSQDEMSFVERLKSILGDMITYVVNTRYRIINKSEVGNFSFFYLSLISINTPILKLNNKMISYSKNQCIHKSDMMSPAIFSFTEAKKLDIFFLFDLNAKRSVIVSRRLKDVFEYEGLLELKFNPCINADLISGLFDNKMGIENYFSEEYYQIVVSEKTKYPCCVSDTKFMLKCNICGKVTAFFYKYSAWFENKALKDVAFQLNDRYNQVNSHNTFLLAIPEIIVTSKVMQIILKEDIFGFENYFSEPPVNIRVVESEETVKDLELNFGI